MLGAGLRVVLAVHVGERYYAKGWVPLIAVRIALSGELTNSSKPEQKLHVACETHMTESNMQKHLLLSDRPSYTHRFRLLVPVSRRVRKATPLKKSLIQRLGSMTHVPLNPLHSMVYS